MAKPEQPDSKTCAYCRCRKVVDATTSYETTISYEGKDYVVADGDIMHVRFNV